MDFTTFPAMPECIAFPLRVVGTLALILIGAYVLLRVVAAMIAALDSDEPETSRPVPALAAAAAASAPVAETPAAPKRRPGRPRKAPAPLPSAQCEAPALPAERSDPADLSESDNRELTTDEFLARYFPQWLTPASSLPAGEALGVSEFPLQAQFRSPRGWSVAGTASVAVDAGSFAPDAAFVLAHYPAMTYYVSNRLLPEDGAVELVAGPGRRWSIPAADFYASPLPVRTKPARPQCGMKGRLSSRVGAGVSE